MAVMSRPCTMAGNLLSSFLRAVIFISFGSTCSILPSLVLVLVARQVVVGVGIVLNNVYCYCTRYDTYDDINIIL